MTIILYMVPEISTATDKFFCHLGQFFALLTPKPQKMKISKNEKQQQQQQQQQQQNAWRYHYFTKVYQKS